MATHSSTLAWKISWMEEPWWAAVHGVAKSQTWLNDFTFPFHFLFFILFFLTLQYCIGFAIYQHDPPQVYTCSPSWTLLLKGNGDPLQCSCLENPRDRGTWWASIYGVVQSRRQLKQFSSSSSPHLISELLCSISIVISPHSIDWENEAQRS